MQLVKKYIVDFLLGLSILFLILNLSACTTTQAGDRVTAQKEQAPAAAQCVTTQRLKEGMAASHVTLRTVLTDPIMIKKFNDFAQPRVDAPLPEGSTEIYFFEKNDVVMILWAKDGCVQGHIVTHWEPIQKWLGYQV